MDVCDRSKQLVGVELDQKVRNLLFHLEVLLHDLIDGIWDEVHDHIEIHLLRLVPIRVKVLSDLDTVLMVQQFQYLQLPIFVSLILEHLLNSYCLPSLSNSGFEDHTK